MDTDKVNDLANRILELTGHTDNIDECLDQWENERQAMMEFFTIVQEQEAVLSKLGKLVDDLAPKIRRKNIEWDKINEIIDLLNKWKEGAVKTHKETMEVKEKWKNLDLFTLQD